MHDFAPLFAFAEGGSPFLCVSSFRTRLIRALTLDEQSIVVSHGDAITAMLENLALNATKSSPF
jgi:hypothetical protein